MMHKYSLFIILLTLPFLAFCQSKIPPDSNSSSLKFPRPEQNLDRDFLLPYQRPLNSKDCKVFTTTNYGANYDKSISKSDSLSFHDYIFRNKGDMIHLNSFKANIYPLFGGDIGDDSYASKKVFNSFGGLHTDGAIGTKFSYSVNYIGGFLNGPAYLDSIIKNDRVVPGLGYAYPQGAPITGYSYQYWDGYVSYYLNNTFSFQVGNGKEFIGDGYRSLLLSDATNSYPYFKITTNIWHIQYTNLYTIMQNVEPSGTTGVKYLAMHFLSWNITKWLNCSLFEAVIWHGNEGDSSYRSFDPSYLNPLIIYRPVEFSLGSPDNELLGATFKLKATKNTQFYGQVLIDDFTLHNTLAGNGFWANKQGVQFGFKEFNLFGAKNISFQSEVDYVRPYTYSEANPFDNYSNYGQPLGDPMGANFIESASFLSFYYKNLIIEGSLVAYHVGFDPSSPKYFDYGQNIFVTYDLVDFQSNIYGNRVAQGVSTYLGTAGLRFAYILSPKMHMKAELGINDRYEKEGSVTTLSPYIYFGIKTSLGNLYSDF
jgi:hypothetical protein